MQLPKLVIASILKPIDDTRMYEKFGVSISQTDKYEVNIIGFSAKKRPDNEKINFHPIFNFSRISISRLVAPFRYFYALYKQSPKIIIITTHELLWASLIYKWLRPCKLIYDIRENYYLNIKYTNSFPLFLKNLIASYVRCKENVIAPSVDQFILAEKSYANELPFIQQKFTIIENKSIEFNTNQVLKTETNNNIIQLLFSGTLANSTGIFEAINLAQNLHEIDARIQLKIIGKSAKSSTLNSIKDQIKEHPYISLIGGDKLVTHSRIIEAILSSDFGIIYYPPNIANDRCIPTKLYEYLHANLPIITDHKPLIKSITDQYTSAVHIDFKGYDPADLLKQMNQTRFYQKLPQSEVLWDSEALKLIEALDL
ncbi:MAG: glycosyltransferase [Fulvivirga sp.]|uniref:glycosyltransferase n=1 Tax=Fulvivirga sp. TaxID=1931237 RepID=UPI0032EEA005